MKKLQAELSISKFHSSDEPDYISITVEDKLSGCQMVEVKVSLEEFAQALFSFAHRPCEVEFNDSGPIGLKREVKTETVFVPDGPWDEREKRAKKAVKKFEKDGWKGSVEDCLNMHRSEGQAEGGWKFRVSFVRFVPAEEGK